MKVLMTTDTVGGVWNYSIELCRSLQLHGVQFVLVTMGRKITANQKKSVDALHHVQVIETGFVLEWMKDPWKDIDASGQWLLELETSIQPDLVHLNGYSFGALRFKAPTIVVAHSDVYSWFKSVTGEAPSSEWEAYYHRVKNGLEGAGLVIAPTYTILENIFNTYTGKIKSRVIRNGRNPKQFYSNPKQPYIFSMGRIWDKAKNIELLSKVAAQIPYEIRIAGEQEFSDNQYSAFTTTINFLGPLDEAQVAKELSSASVFASPAKYEPFGLSVLEAALSGCALVLGNIASLKELWDDAAVYVDTDDPKELADLLNHLMKDPGTRSVLSKKAQEKAKEYTSSFMAENYLDSYTMMIHAKNQRSEIA